MRMSNLFGRTLRETPADAEIPSHTLLVRAGMIRPLAAGVYSYMPLGWRTLRRIEHIIREEMDAIDGQEVSMPVMHPAEIWKETGRWYELGPELVRFQDRGNRDMVLGMTHEEVVTYLTRQEISSYRQMPAMIYQFQTKIRDEPRSRGGLIRVREFIMKDAYSLDVDFDGLDEFYPRIYQAYVNVFERCGLDPLVVEADPGMMGGSDSHEFMLVNENGEDTVVVCASCEYKANRENAHVAWPVDDEEMRPTEEVSTPGIDTIAGLADFLDIPERKTSKIVFYTADGELVFTVIRGDLDINETKLAGVLGTSEFEPASEAAIEEVGAVPGYASPIALEGEAKIIVDESIPSARNLVAGANKAGYHLRNVNYGRDYEADEVVDIATVRDGDACPQCGDRLKLERAIELGHIFKLGTRYSEPMGATYLDADGEERPVVMGSYGIGLGRLMAAIAEKYHDEYGLIWPPSVAPAGVYLISLASGDEEIGNTAEELYQSLRDEGFSVLFDDRDERAGVKFNDADLIGAPVRLTVSSRAQKRGGIEIKARWSDASEVIPIEDLPSLIREYLGSSSRFGGQHAE
ncbi:MAG: Proline--tRNA ligase [Anaerolineales bacterium]|nr:Proline--tRNA ligase [Anaerolineales bacterium]